MIQIRQKRQEIRKKIRKQYLQNHFKTLRKRYFNLGDDSQSQGSPNIKALQTLLAKSQQLNKLVNQIREGNLFQELNILVQSSIDRKDKLQAKYLLTIIPNIFRDQINPFQKEELFKISIKLFQSLSLSFVDFKSKEERKEYKNTLEIISSQVLSYYFSNMIVEGQFLQEQDQQYVEKNIYPALVNLLFYSLKHPKLIGGTQNFCKDFQKAIYNIFDLKDSSYETGNMLKSKRNVQFFINIVMNHYFYMNERSDFPDFFDSIQRNLFFLYDKLTEYFQQISEFFKTKELWMVIQLTFQQQIRKQSSIKIIHIYSILTTFTDNDCFINQIEHLLLTNTNQFNMINFEIILRQLTYKESKRCQILQFLQAIMISYRQKNNFKQTFQTYGSNLFQILTNIFLQFDRYSLSNNKQIKILIKTLLIICSFIQKANQSLHSKPNQYILSFQKNQGTKKFQQITEWSEEYDLNNSSDLFQVLELIEWLSYQFQFTSSEEQLEI